MEQFRRSASNSGAAEGNIVKFRQRETETEENQHCRVSGALCPSRRFTQLGFQRNHPVKSVRPPPLPDF